MAREVSQLRAQQLKLRAVCESEIQRATTDATSGIEGLQLRWRQVHTYIHVFGICVSHLRHAFLSGKDALHPPRV